MANRTEEISQARLVKWSHKREVRALMPALRWLYHSPAGGKRDAFTGAQMKALGTKPGFPDLIIPAGSGLANGLVIEMKTAKGRASPEQEEWLAHLRSERWTVHVCRSEHEARTCICEYFGLDPATAPGFDD